jgi:hypothetical protein
MKTMMMGAAVVAALLAGPAIAKEKRAMKEQGSQQSTSLSKEDQSRLQNSDGTLQGKPVVQGPAHWDNSGSESSSSGSSSGESGSESGGASR